MSATGATREAGIILRPIQLGDSSKIVSALTPNFGRVKLVAKGSRQLGSRLGPLLESGNELDLILYPHATRDLWILGDAGLVRSALTGGNTLNKLSHLFASMELADRLLPEREPVPELESLYRNYLDDWHRTGDGGQYGLFFALELALMEAAGTGLDPAQCSACSTSLVGAGRAGVRAFEGDILCTGCARGQSRWLDAQSLQDLQTLARRPLGAESGGWPVLEPASRQQVGRLLHEHLSLHAPGYRLPASLYWLAPDRAVQGPDR